MKLWDGWCLCWELGAYPSLSNERSHHQPPQKVAGNASPGACLTGAFRGSAFVVAAAAAAFGAAA